VVLKVATSWKESSREMKLGSIVTSQRVNARVWNWHISFACQEKVQTHPTAGRLMLTLFGTHKGYCWNIIKRGVQQ
jgi:hypothetical protein